MAHAKADEFLGLILLPGQCTTQQAIEFGQTFPD